LSEEEQAYFFGASYCPKGYMMSRWYVHDWFHEKQRLKEFTRLKLEVFLGSIVISCGLGRLQILRNPIISILYC